MTTEALPKTTSQCGPGLAGGWQCYPRDCTRPREACVMQYVWDLYKPHPKDQQ